MKKLISCVLLGAAMLVPSGMDAATVRLRSRTLSYSEDTPYGKIDIMFSKCMANQLYTFLSVSVDGTILNQTSSDNIGPFLAGGEWMGGNHTLSSGAKSAKTVSYSVALDGEELTGTVSMEGKILTVEVKNEIVYSDGQKFCDETVHYTVSGNSIEVRAHHDYTHPSSISINRYYGMQSMFDGETEILIPGTPKKLWQKLTVTSTGNEIEIKKKDAPNFCTFVEHSSKGYQASYLFREGLGNREWVKDNDVVYIGNSWSKSYHKTIGDHAVKNGDSSDWHGLYSWFKAPVADNCRKESDDNTFAYGAYINGVHTIMTVQADGTMKAEEVSGVEDVTVDNVAPIATVSNNTITVAAEDAECFDVAGKLVHSGAGSFSASNGIYVVSDRRGNSVKLLVK